MTNRLFITLDIPEIIIKKIIELRNKFYDDKQVRWESRDKLHITAKFLGDTNTELIPELEKLLFNVSKEFCSLELVFNRFGIFYRNYDPRVFWIGAEENLILSKLVNRIEEKCLEVGFKNEKKKIHPHLTLLRIKGHENFTLLEKIKQSKIDPINFSANTISLMKSELKPSGSVYTIIKSFELSKTEE